MLTDTEILAGDPAVTPEGQLALSNLVRRSKQYNSARAFYGNVRATLLAIVTAGSLVGATPEAVALAKALGAVVTKLKTLPPISVDSEGSDQARSFFSTTDNWEELALDVLNIAYETDPAQAEIFGTVTRKLYDMWGYESTVDELLGTAGYWAGYRHNRYGPTSGWY